METKNKMVGIASEDVSFSLGSEVYIIDDVVEHEDAYRLLCRVGNKKKIVIVPKIGEGK